MQTFTKEKLYKLGIYELRTVARNIGVRCPTKLKKEEMIDCIFSILSGKEKPYVNTSKKGRPPKDISNLNDIKSIFKENEKEVIYTEIQNNTFDDDTFKQSNTGLKLNEKEVRGLYKVINKTYGIVAKNHFNLDDKPEYIILPDLAEEYDIRQGDEINCICASKDNNFYVTEILTINGVSTNKNIGTEKVNRPHFEELNYEFSNRKVKLSQNVFAKNNTKLLDKICPLILGDRVALQYYDNDLNSHIIEDILKIGKDNINTTVLSINDMPEYIQKLKLGAANVNFITKYNITDNNLFLEELLLKYENILRQVESGKDELLILLDYNKIIDYFSYVVSIKKGLTVEQAKLFVKDYILKVFSQAKATKNGGSLTIIAVNCAEKSMIDICSNLWIFNEQPYEGTNITLDLKNSCSRTIKLNAKEEHNKILKIKQDIDIKGVIEIAKSIINKSK